MFVLAFLADGASNDPSGARLSEGLSFVSRVRYLAFSSEPFKWARMVAARGRARCPSEHV